MTDDAELHSPITERIPFKGRERVLELFEEIFDLLGRVEIIREVDSGNHKLLEVDSELAGRHAHLIQLLRLAPDGRVEDVTLFMRPMPTVVTLFAELGPRLVRRRYGRIVAFFVTLPMKPIAFAIRLMDRLSPRFA